MVKGWLLGLWLVASAHAAFDSINKDIVIKSCDRTVDLTTQLVKLQFKMVIENQGKGAVKSILFSLDPNLKSKVSFIGATFGTSEKTYLRVEETKVQSDMDKPFWKIELKSSLSAGASTTITVEVVLGGALEMFPAAISQKEKQLARFSGNLYVYSPYNILTQTSTVQLASSNLESYTKTKPVSLSDSSITYGPHNNIAPFSSGEMVIHGENNSPMLVVSRLERVIEVSMWGNIAVEETIDVVHKGAALKGSFSRYEFQRENSGVSSVKNFKTLLPAAAKDVYYRDDIGNISTSHMKVMDDAVELDLRPRFPLFGGWKTHYVTGYNVPSYEYLFFKADQHVLNMRLIDHIFDDMLVEEVEVKIILPEGVSDLKLSTPYPMTRGEDSLHYTYLDTTGRTVVSLYSNKLLSENHIQDFQLGFTYPHRTMLSEPLLLVAAFFLLYLMAIIYARLDFSITLDEGAEAKMKLQ
jgi:oligosaccharyltransferase complex subunit alpha (ribophorin I)